MGARYFTIFASMRTGSNLLERLLGDYAGLRAEGELFNAHFIGQPGRTAYLGRCLNGRDGDPASFLSDVIREAAPDIPGFRLFDGHAPKMLAHAARDPAAAKIILTRNPVDSFISLKIAARTGQWMLRNADRRRLRKVRFIARDFESYRAGLDAHYAALRALIGEAGQEAAEIAYDRLGDVAALNRLAAMIGSAEIKMALAPDILRQNPPDWADKVENVEELMAYVVGRPELAPTGGPAGSPLDDMVAVRGVEAIFALTPGAADEAVVGLLSRLGGWGRVARGLKPVHVARRRRRGAFAFTFVRHPAARLLAVFAARMTAEDPLPRILARDHGAPFAAAPTAAGFDAFLDFIEASRRGRAALPPSPEWESQSALVDRYQSIAPLDFIGRAERMAEDGAAVIRRLNGAVAPPAPPPAPDAPWFGRGREERLRALYAEDYERFGYDWMTD